MLASNVAAATAPPAPWSDQRVIFTAELAQKTWGRHAGSNAFWTPALADVLALEQRLPDFLHAQLDRQLRPSAGKDPLWERAKTYKRQYLGVRPKGRRVVFANFFCRDFGKDWRTEPVVVKDGGDCYFSVDYDVDKGSFSNLMINGEA